MISMNAISSAGGAANYYTAQAEIEYYANEIVPSAWGGRGLAFAGYSGTVSAEDLTQALAGEVRERGDADGEFKQVRLGRTVIDKETGERVIEHRAGWDLTFAPPKSVSLESEVFGRQDVRQAHEAAVVAAMGYLEGHAAQTKYRHQVVATGNLVYASFAHATSRAGDPQTHTHVLIANVTYLDGKAYSLTNEQILRQRTTADAVYRNELANGLTRLGYGLDFDGRGHFEIAGYDRQQLAEFSKRSQQIDEALIERGSSKAQASHEARQTAALATRDDKAFGHSESAVVHRERWQAQARSLGITAAVQLEHDRRAMPSAQALIASAADSLAEREQEFSKRDLVKEAMLQSSGRSSSGELLAEITAQAQAGALLARPSNWTGERFTTPAAIAGELWADRQLQAGRDAHTAILGEREFERALVAFEMRKGFELNDEQRQAARQILTRADQFSGVQGAAGTGKTTMLEFVREAAESRGWVVQGLSNGAAQASKLQADSGIASSTTASFLARQRARVVGGTGGDSGPAKLLYINDEASMSGQRDFNGVIQAALVGGAKTVFVGDKAQHQSVAAGSAFERAQDKIQVAWLQQIKRQTTEQARAPVREAIADNPSQALRKTALEFGQAREQVERKWSEIAVRRGQGAEPGVEPSEASEPRREIFTRAQASARREEIRAARVADNQVAIGAIARDYTALAGPQRERTAVITSTNADREAINEAIRGQLIEAGEINSAGTHVQTLQRKDLTRAQAGQASSYAPGDVLKQTLAPASDGPGRTGGRRRRSRPGRGSEGSQRYLSVEGINAQDNTVEVRVQGFDRGEGGDRLTIAAAELAATVAYTVQPREFAPGDRVAFLENSREFGVANGELGTVRRIDAKGMTVSLSGDGASREVTREIRFDAYRQIDHGYVMTSHKAQGQTVDRTLIHHNTEAGMHGRREAYVNVTRARLSTTTYTQDRERAAEQAARVVDKTQAVAKPRGMRRGVEWGKERGNDKAQRADRQPSLPEQGRQREAQPHTQAQAPALANSLAADELRFAPLSYADVTLEPGQRLDLGADLLAQRVPPKLELAQALEQEAMAFAQGAAERFMTEQAAREFAQGAHERFLAELDRRQQVDLAQQARQQANLARPGLARPGLAQADRADQEASRTLEPQRALQPQPGKNTHEKTQDRPLQQGGRDLSM